MTDTMPAELVENLIDFCENRGRVYALLSRCYETEIDAAFAGTFSQGAALSSDDPASPTGSPPFKLTSPRATRASSSSWPSCSTALSSAWGRARRRRPSPTSRCTRARAVS